MFGRHPDGRMGARQVLLVLVPVLLGVVGLVLLAENRTSGTPSRLETQGTVLPSSLAVDGPENLPATQGPRTTSAVPAGGDAASVGTSGVAGASSSPGIGSPSTSGAGPASGGETTAARTTSGVDGGAEGGVDGGAGGGVEGSGTPSASRTSGGVDGSSTSTAPPDSTTSTTVAPEVTTTTTVAPEVTTTTTSPPRATSPARAPSAEAEVVPLTNADRAAANLGPLARNSCLDSVASRYAEQMARSGVLAHNPGAQSAIRGCRPGAAWGDNVGTSAPCDIAFIEEKWMASATHRKNILTEAFQLMGVGAWTDSQGGCWVQVVFSS